MGIPCLAAGMPSPSPRLISVYLSLCLLTAAAPVSVSDSLEDSVSREDSHVKSENEDKSTRQGRQFANFLGVSGHGRCRQGFLLIIPTCIVNAIANIKSCIISGRCYPYIYIY